MLESSSVGMIKQTGQKFCVTSLHILDYTNIMQAVGAQN